MKKKWLQHDPEKDQSLENFVAWTYETETDYLIIEKLN